MSTDSFLADVGRLLNILMAISMTSAVCTIVLMLIFLLLMAWPGSSA